MSAQLPELAGKTDSDVMSYAAMMADVENAIVVVSDVSGKSSRIFLGGFAERFDIAGYRHENSIWEKMILSLMPEEELEAKVIAELRFFHFLKGKPKTRKSYYLLTKLRFKAKDGNMVDVAHKLFYVYDENFGAVRYAVCRYSPLLFDFRGRSMVVNSIDGTVEELSANSVSQILSRREFQVLKLISEGKKSSEIASVLNVSIHTVSRHRQEILSKLQVKNSMEAVRRARSMGLI